MIIDSSVLIHLTRIGKLELLKGFFRKITITKNIYRETVIEGRIGASEIEDACKDWIEVEEFKDVEKAKKLAKLENITEADASILLLAKERKEKLLSNDYILIKLARSKGIESWWLTTLLLKAVKERKLNKKEMKNILFDLIKSGMRISVEVYAKILEKIEEY